MSDSVDGDVDWKMSYFAALQERDASQAREAELREKLAAAEADLAENRRLAHTNMQTLHEYKRKAEAAEARIKELEAKQTK